MLGGVHAAERGGVHAAEPASASAAEPEQPALPPRQLAPTTAKEVRREAEQIGKKATPGIRVFYHECYLILVDCMNSVLGRTKYTKDFTVICDESSFLRHVLPKYKSFFAKAAAAFQKCIYFFSSPAEFWGIAEQDRCSAMVAQVASLAKQSRFLAMDSVQLFSFLREYRLDLWHFATNRQVYWGLQASWQHIFESMLVFARCISVPPMLALALDTMPLAPITHETAERDIAVNLPLCRRLIEPAPSTHKLVRSRSRASLWP